MEEYKRHEDEMESLVLLQLGEERGRKAFSFVRAISALLNRMGGYTALLLSGSLARAAGDKFSDVDLVAVFREPINSEALTKLTRDVACTDDVIFIKSIEHVGTINIIFTEWIRIDIRCVAMDALKTIDRSMCLPIYDPQSCVDHLGEMVFIANRRECETHLTEFIRVYSLLSVVLGRGELELGFAGAARLQFSLVTVLSVRSYVRCGLRDRPGALKLRSYLTAEEAKELSELPSLELTRESIIAYHRSCMAVFELYGPGIARDLKVDWPSEFLSQAKRHFIAEFGE